MAREPTPMLRVQLRLAAGGWVPVCRANAERLLGMPHVEVEHKPFLRTWSPLRPGYDYKPRMQFRARSKR